MAALLSLAVLIGWQMLFPPPPIADAPPTQGVDVASQIEVGARDVQGGVGAGADAAGPGSAATTTQTVEQTAGESESPVEPLVIEEPTAGTPGKRVELSTESWRAVFDTTGARLVSMSLLERHGVDGKPVELVRHRGPGQPQPFSIVDRGGFPGELDTSAFAIEEQSSDQIRFVYRGPAGIAEKTFRVGSDGLLEYDVSVQSPRDWSLWFGPGVGNPEWKDFDNRFSKAYRQATLKRDELDSRQTSKIKTSETSLGSGVAWFSLEDKYFLMALVPRQEVAQVTIVPVRASGDEDQGVSGYVRAEDDPDAEGPLDAALVVTPAGERTAGTSFWGAKEYTRLRELPYGFEETVRFGTFGLIARPLLYGLRWIHNNVTPNWGWSIVLMTLAINLVLFPLRHKSFISMQKMQKLNPRMEAIRSRYRPKLRDKQGKPNIEMQRKMNEEIQGLFKAEGVNPAMGCLPLLIQMPVFFAFYRLLGQAVELQGAPWIGWISDLSLQDPIKALPLLMGATQFLQTKTMPPASNPTQRILMNTMPIWFTFFAFTFPAGLVLYWLTNNTLTIIQQAGYNQLKKAGYLGGVTETDANKKKGGKKSKKD